MNRREALQAGLGIAVGASIPLPSQPQELIIKPPSITPEEMAAFRQKWQMLRLQSGVLTINDVLLMNT